jgi:hypothetical protein
MSTQTAAVPARVKVSEITSELRKAKFDIQREARKMCGKRYVSTAFDEAEVVIPDAGFGFALVFRYRVITNTDGFGPYQFWSMAL